MTTIAEQLEKLEALKETNLGNLGLVGTNTDGTSITLAGVVKNSTGELVYVDSEGNETKLQTVEADSGFSRFVFTTAGAFPLIADSNKDTVQFDTGNGIKIETDPSTDSMIWSIDATTLFDVVGSGATLFNPLGELRTLLTGSNLQITELPDELLFEVSLDPVDIGTGEVSLHAGADVSTGKPALRTMTASSTVQFTVTNDTIQLTAIPNLVNLGSGSNLVVMNSGVGEIRTLLAGDNVSLMQEADGSLKVGAVQQHAAVGAGLSPVSSVTAGIWNVRTLKAGPRIDLQIDGDDSILVTSNTDILSVGAGVTLGFVDSGVGKIKSLVAGAGIVLNDAAEEVEVVSNVRAQDVGDGLSQGTLEADGSLSLKTIKSADGQLIVTEDNGGILLTPNPDDYLVNASLQDALDGSGDPFHLLLDTNRNTTIDAGPIPYCQAYAVSTVDSNGDPITEIHVYNRASFVGKIPADNPANPYVAAVDGDWMAMAGVNMWDYGEDLMEPRNQIIHIDLEL